MGLKKETAEQKSKRLAAVAHNLRVKSDYQKVCKVIRGREDLISRFKQELVNLGELVVDPNAKAAPGTFVSASEAAASGAEQAAHEQLQDADVDESATATASPDAPADCASPMLHRNFATWAVVPPSHVQSFLAYAEPVSFGAGNMRNLLKRSCKVAPRGVLLELFEYVTGLDPTSSVPHRSLEDLKFFVKDHNFKNGRPARDLELPADWQKHGHYTFAVKPPCLTISCKSSGTHIILPNITTTSDDEDAIVIDANYSKARASICLPTRSGINIACEFAKQGVSLLAEAASPFESTTVGDAASSIATRSSSSMQFVTPQAKRSRTSPSPSRYLAAGGQKDEKTGSIGAKTKIGGAKLTSKRKNPDDATVDPYAPGGARRVVSRLALKEEPDDGSNVEEDAGVLVPAPELEALEDNDGYEDIKPEPIEDDIGADASAMEHQEWVAPIADEYMDCMDGALLQQALAELIKEEDYVPPPPSPNQ